MEISPSAFTRSAASPLRVRRSSLVRPAGRESSVPGAMAAGRNSGAVTCRRNASISRMTAATAAAPSAMTARVRESVQRRLLDRVAMFRLALMAER